MDNLTSLPERWCVIATNDNEAELLADYANKKQNGNGWNNNNSKKILLTYK